jgi:3-hydroxyisobutyrate dehydrogenase-like beta-hydroxyacid dehydrogenase
MVLADQLNLKRETVAKVLADVPALSPFMKMRLPNLVEEKFDTLFSVANMNKDLKLALAELNGQRLPVLENISKTFMKATKMGLSDQDISAIIKVLKSKAG